MTVVQGFAADPDERAADLVLARIHLRLGSLGLARAELEALAGRNGLDDEGIRDLAEVRWRTGDLPGAGEAAAAYLESKPDDVLSLIISAELQASLGRPGEARKLAGRALTKSDVPVDRIFAGMPRSPIWPIDPGAPVEPVGTLFTDLPTQAWPDIGAVGERSEDVPEVPAEPPAPDGPGLWDAHGGTLAAKLPSAAELLARARTAVEAGRPGQAAAGLALALRADPTLALPVLELLAGRQEPVLALVRGDAHRIVGHEAEAMRDYAASVAAMSIERRSDRSRGGTRRDARRPGAAQPPSAADGTVRPPRHRPTSRLPMLPGVQPTAEAVDESVAPTEADANEAAGSEPTSRRLTQPRLPGQDRIATHSRECLSESRLGGRLGLHRDSQSPFPPRCRPVDGVPEEKATRSRATLPVAVEGPSGERRA